MSTLSNSAHGSMRHARHGSDDQRKQMKQPKAATASPTSWRSVRLARSHSQTSEYSTDDELESPNLVPRFSASSTLTTLTTPRSSIPSPELPSKPPNTRIGQRVRVEHMGLTGTLRFLGTTQFKAGVWAGIELDTPGAGKNDGSVEGVKYFSCAPKSGIFVQSSKIIFEIPSKPRNTSSRFTPVSRPSRFQSSTDTPIALSKQKSMPSLRARYRQQQQQPQQHLSTSTRSATPAQSLSHGIPSPEITPTKCDLTTPSNQRDPRRIDEHRSNTIMEGGHVEKEDQDECLDCIQLQLDNTQLQADLAATKSKLAQVNEALSSNTELVMSYQERIENLENTIQELKHAGMETIELYEKSVQQHGIDAKCSAEKLAAAHDKLQSLEAERDSLLSAKEKLEQELEKRRKEKDDRVQDMEKTIHQLEQQLQQQQGNNKEEMEAIKSAWKSNVHDLEKQLALAKQDLETERTEHAATKEQVATMHGEIQQKYDALAKEFDEYRQSMESQQRSLSTKLHDSEEQADALKRQIATLEDKLQAQQREINDNEYQRIQQLEASNAQLQQELAMLQRQHTQLQSEYKCLRERNKELPPIPEGAVVSLSSPWQLQQMLTNAQREIERLREEHERQLSEQEKAHRQQVNILNRDIAQLESLIEAKIFKEADLMEALDHERKLIKRLLSDHRSGTGSANSSSSHQTHPSSHIHRRRETAIISISSAPSVDVPGIPEENDNDIPFCDICQESGHDLMSCSTILSQLPRTQQCNAIPNREKDTLVSFSEHSHVF